MTQTLIAMIGRGFSWDTVIDRAQSLHARIWVFCPLTCIRPKQLSHPKHPVQFAIDTRSFLLFGGFSRDLKMSQCWGKKQTISSQETFAVGDQTAAGCNRPKANSLCVIKSHETKTRFNAFRYKVYNILQRCSKNMILTVNLIIFNENAHYLG